MNLTKCIFTKFCEETSLVPVQGLMMKVYRRIAFNTGILYIRMAITVLLSLYTTKVTLSALGVSDFGTFSLLGSIISMLTFLSTGMATATQRFMSHAQGSESQEALRTIFNVSVIMHAVMGVGIFFFLEVSGWILFNTLLNVGPDRMAACWFIYQVMIASTVLMVIAVPYEAVINARENMLLFAILGIVEAVAKLLAVLWIRNTDEDRLIAYGLLMSVISIVLLALRAGYCHLKYSECFFSPTRYFSRPLSREMTSFASWSLLGASTSLVALYGQGLVLNIFFGTMVNAAQGVANQVSGQLGAFASTMLRALNPTIAKCEGAGNRTLMLETSMIGSKVGFFLLVPLFVPVLLETPFLLKAWLGDPPIHSIAFCRLLLIRNLIDQLFVTLPTTISAVGRIRSYQTFTSILNLAPLGVSYMLLTKGFPPESIYYTFIAYSIASSCLMLYFASRDCSLSASTYITNIVLRCGGNLLTTAAIAVLPLFFLNIGWTRIIYVLVMGTLAFFVSAWFIGLTTRERKMIATLVSEFSFRRLYRASVP